MSHPIPYLTYQIRIFQRASFPFQIPLRKANLLLQRHHCTPQFKYTSHNVTLESQLRKTTKTDEVGHCGAAPASTRALNWLSRAPTPNHRSTSSALLAATRLPSHSKLIIALVNVSQIVRFSLILYIAISVIRCFSLMSSTNPPPPTTTSYANSNSASTKAWPRESTPPTYGPIMPWARIYW